MNVKNLLLGLSLLATGIFVSCEDKLEAPKALESNPIPASADFSYTTNKPDFVYPLDVNFEDKSERAVSFSWNFGDTTTTADVSSDKNPTYTYNIPGKYVVRLIVTSAEGKADTVDRVVDVRFARKKLLGSFNMTDTLSQLNNTNADSLTSTGKTFTITNYKSTITVVKADSSQIRIANLSNNPSGNALAVVNGTSFTIAKQPFGSTGYEISGSGSVVENILRIHYVIDRKNGKTYGYKSRGEL
jgi:PKD repeat protein